MGGECVCIQVEDEPGREREIIDKGESPRKVLGGMNLQMPLSVPLFMFIY